MSVTTGQELELRVEKPASGGRMIARHEGEVLLVGGAIPGERVVARVTRADKRVAFAETLRVLEPSSDRRDVRTDPSCGGCVYAFIDYARQIQLKSEIIRDAFGRIGRIPIEGAVEIRSSPEARYRMRARFHVQDGKAGFYREGSHALCDPRGTEQLEDASVDAVEAAVGSLTAQGIPVVSVELSENIAGDQRALHLDLRDAKPPPSALERVVRAAGLTGCTARSSDTTSYSAGDPIVSDPLAALTRDRGTDGLLRRHPEAFFQGNRFLLADLVTAVLDSVLGRSVLDLYAGVGLFAVPLAARGASVTAVEGDPVSSRDLVRNAASFHDHLRVVRSSVEAFLARGGQQPVDTLIVDPPRTGMSRDACDKIAHSGVTRIVYVSCDAPTLARDARRLIDAGYRLAGLRGFDLFPNTPHVESVGTFER